MHKIVTMAALIAVFVALPPANGPPGGKSGVKPSVENL